MCCPLVLLGLVQYEPGLTNWACSGQAQAAQDGSIDAVYPAPTLHEPAILPSVVCRASTWLRSLRTDIRRAADDTVQVGEVPLMSYQTLLSNKRFPLFPYFWPGGREGAASQRGSKSKRRKCVNVCPHTDLSTFKRRERQRPKEAIASYAEIDSCDEGFLHAAFAVSSTTRPQARSRTLLLLWSTFRLRLIRFGQ